MVTPEESRRRALQTIAEMRLPPDTTITCENCTDNDKCDFAFDPYNTNGDCLAIK